MSEQNPRKAGISPSPLTLAFLIVFATITVVGAISLFIVGMAAPATTMTGAPPNAAALEIVTQTSPSSSPTSQASPTSFPIPETVVVNTPTVRPTLPLPPSPTIYIAGPTAQFSTPIPIAEWSVYEDGQAGFSIRYPPDWYLKTTQPEDRIFGSTTQLSSFDPNDPILEAKPPQPIPNFTKLEIIVVDNLEATGESFPPNQTIDEWVRTSRAIDDSVQDQLELIDEGPTEVGGVPAYFQVIRYASGGVAKTTYVYHNNKLVFINHRFEEAGSFNGQVLQQMIDSISFN